MEIDLTGRGAAIIGDRNLIAEAVADALAANGALVTWPSVDAPAAAHTPTDILVVSCRLQLDPPAETEAALMRVAAVIGRRMADRGGGRVVFLLSALGIVPMRRHPDYSAWMAGSLAAIRGLAMQLGPHVLLNAVGIGLIQAGGDGAIVAGDSRMSSHVASPHIGRPKDIADAALFLCDPLNSYMTGQVLTVDGGWSAGYGRNF